MLGLHPLVLQFETYTLLPLTELYLPLPKL